MSGNRFRLAILISLAVHLGLLCLIGTTSASRPPVLLEEELRIVQVDLVREPEEAVVSAPEVPEPQRVDIPEPPESSPPPVSQTRPDPPRTQRVSQPTPQPVQPRQRPSTQAQSSRPAGDPGGALAIGTPSPRGQDLGRVEGGRTPVGWVPSPSGGQGMGSGTGSGVGRPDPVPDASLGPGREPAPQPTPPPPPPVRTVDLVVCQVSGDRPNQHCENTIRRSFEEGRQPRRTCDKCRPKPKHESRLAEARDAVRIKDAPVVLPDSVRERGIDARVTVTYTVGTDGNVSDVVVTTSSGNRAVDRAVAAAAAKMKYKPATQDGVPRSIKMRRTYHIRC